MRRNNRIFRQSRLTTWGILCCFLAIGSVLSAQPPSSEISVQADIRFLSDTTAVGRPIGLRIQVSHPKEIIVFFPRRPKLFKPFEPVSIEAKPTRIKGEQAYDEAILYVRTFAMDPVQYLSLPIGYLVGRDTLWRQTNTDSVKLKFRVQGSDLPLLSFQGTPEPIALSDPPNYVLWGAILVAAIMGILGIFSLLRKPLARYAQRRKLGQEYVQIEKRRKQVAQMTDPILRIEALNNIWKEYLDPSLNLSLKSLTRTELAKALPQLTHLTPVQQELLSEIAYVNDNIIFAQMPADTNQLEHFRQALAPILLTEFERRKLELKQKAV